MTDFEEGEEVVVNTFPPLAFTGICAFHAILPKELTPVAKAVCKLPGLLREVCLAVKHH